jgi:hypothetical protein
MPRLKNIRHERFCYEFIKTGNRRQAYEAVYDPDGTRLRPNVAKTMGWQLLNLYPEVPKRIEEIRVAMQKKSDITIEKILSDYQYALDIAKNDGKPDSIVNAATAQAKLVGLLKDRIVNEPSEIEQMENISDILERVGQEAGADVALALAKAFGIEAPMPETKSETISDSPTDIGEPPTSAVN